MTTKITSLTTTLATRWQALPQGFRFGTLVFFTTRLIYSLWAVVILTIHPASTDMPQPVIRNVIEKWLIAPWYRWDAEWFLKIAQEGYTISDGRSAYYPLYPFLTRIVGDLLGQNYLLAGLIVSNLATWAALVLLYRVTCHHFSETVAKRTVVALASYPFYIFNLIYYADSLLLLFSLAVFWAMQNKRWNWVGVFAALAVLSKLPGLVLLAPIGWEFMAQRRRWLSTDILAVLAIPLVIGLWTITLRFIGNEVALTDFSSSFSVFTPILTPSYQQEFKASLVWPWQGLLLGMQAIPALWTKLLFLKLVKVVLDLLIVIIFTIAIPFTWRLPRFSYFVYGFGLYVMNLTVVMPWTPLGDFPRRMIVAFPVFIVLGLAMENRWANRIIFVAGVLLSAIVSSFLLWWAWIG